MIIFFLVGMCMAPQLTAQDRARGAQAPSAPTGRATDTISGDLSLSETEVRAKDDLARRLQMNPADIRVVEAAKRNWPDAGLGCTARRGVLPPAMLAGYRIVLAVGPRTYTYHTDQRGKLLRCETPSKPLGPIT